MAVVGVVAVVVQPLPLELALEQPGVDRLSLADRVGIALVLVAPD